MSCAFCDPFLFYIVCSFLLCLCLLIGVSSCNNALLSVVCCGGCFIVFVVILLFFEFNSFIVFFFLVYSSFFLVVFLCVGAFVGDLHPFAFLDVIFVCLFLFLLVIVDFALLSSANVMLFLIDNVGFYAFGNFTFNDSLYGCIVSEKSDIAFLGELLFKEYPLLVLVAGILLFIGILCIPLLCNTLLRLQGAYIRSKSKKVLKRASRKHL